MVVFPDQERQKQAANITFVFCLFFFFNFKDDFSVMYQIQNKYQL